MVLGSRVLGGRGVGCRFHESNFGVQLLGDVVEPKP